MFELKEVGRLYTAEKGYRLVVGTFDHPLDEKRTAALQYYHLTEDDGSIFKGSTMAELRSAIELGKRTLVKDHLNLIEVVLAGRRTKGETETTTYDIDEDFKKATAN